MQAGRPRSVGLACILGSQAFQVSPAFHDRRHFGLACILGSQATVNENINTISLNCIVIFCNDKSGFGNHFFVVFW
ncbi:MAG: hypothetical protein LBP59_15245 [Planctomycetaceae bacterium]|nr:hypothetical protein [Planctomycetaceae bacterium]